MKLEQPNVQLLKQAARELMQEISSRSALLPIAIQLRNLLKNNKPNGQRDAETDRPLTREDIVGKVLPILGLVPFITLTTYCFLLVCE